MDGKAVVIRKLDKNKEKVKGSQPLLYLYYNK